MRQPPPNPTSLPNAMTDASSVMSPAIYRFTGCVRCAVIVSLYTICHLGVLTVLSENDVLRLRYNLPHWHAIGLNKRALSDYSFIVLIQLATGIYFKDNFMKITNILEAIGLIDHDNKKRIYYYILLERVFK